MTGPARALLERLRTRSSQGPATSTDHRPLAAESTEAGVDQTQAEDSAQRSPPTEAALAVATVTRGLGEVKESIAHLSDHVAEAAAIADGAVTVADSSGRSIEKLARSSMEMANVIKAIDSIADQTNLLALNARIEAARAGEAGREFTVVANEVKELSDQISTAIEEVSAKVHSVQDDTAEVIQANEEVCQSIRQLSQISATITTTVRGQAVAVDLVELGLTKT